MGRRSPAAAAAAAAPGPGGAAGPGRIAWVLETLPAVIMSVAAMIRVAHPILLRKYDAGAGPSVTVTVRGISSTVGRDKPCGSGHKLSGRFSVARDAGPT